MNEMIRNRWIRMQKVLDFCKRGDDCDYGYRAKSTGLPGPRVGAGNLPAPW